MQVRVEAFAGYKANERPQRLCLGERTIEITEVVDRWYGERESYFRVSGNDGNTYVLKYVEADDHWELASFTSKGSQGTPLDDAGNKLH